MFTIPALLLERVQLAQLTPARLTEILRALEAAINKHGTEDASITLEYTLRGEVYGESDLVPVLTLGLRKAVPSPAKPGLELPRP
jgi:hypothetical protein